MKFKCKKCNKIQDLYKVKYVYHFKYGYVCKEAFCCDNFMDQVKTKEYDGMPTIHRNEPKHSTSYDSDKLWKDAKKKLASGEPPKNNKK